MIGNVSRHCQKFLQGKTAARWEPPTCPGSGGRLRHCGTGQLAAGQNLPPRRTPGPYQQCLQHPQCYNTWHFPSIPKIPPAESIATAEASHLPGSLVLGWGNQTSKPLPPIHYRNFHLDFSFGPSPCLLPGLCRDIWPFPAMAPLSPCSSLARLVPLPLPTPCLSLPAAQGLVLPQCSILRVTLGFHLVVLIWRSVLSLVSFSREPP